MLMKRRTFLLAASSLVAGHAHAQAEKPWTARILTGEFDGTAYHAGLHVTLLSGWKTYWRVPGQGGIPPQITGSGSNLKSFAFDCPVPTRFSDASGESIGYKGEVVFPFRVEPVDTDLPATVQISSFIGVCETICIPAQYDDALRLMPSSSVSPDVALLQHWEAMVPRRVDQQGPVSTATATLVQGKPAVVLRVSIPVDDIFIEGNPMHYFGAAQVRNGEATLMASGANSLEELRATSLRITLKQGETGLEQALAVV